MIFFSIIFFTVATAVVGVVMGALRLFLHAAKGIGALGVFGLLSWLIVRGVTTTRDPRRNGR